MCDNCYMTLRDYRLEKGLSLAEVAAQVSAITGTPYTWTASREWELRGISKAAVLGALETVYGKTREEIMAAALGSKEKRYTPLTAGRPKKKVAA